ncbi:MAG: CHAT domain-containing protein [Myxococcota bacterium]
MSMLSLLWVTFLASVALADAPYDTVREALRRGEPVAADFDALLQAEDRIARDGLLTGTPDERRARLAPLEASTSRIVSAHLQHAADDRDLADLALRTLIRRKGQLIDAEYATRQAVRDTADADGKKLLTELTRATRRLDSLVRRTSTPPGKLREARKAVNDLQRALAEASRPYRAVASFVGTAEVASTLDRRGLLVEFAVFRPWDLAADTFGPPHYAVYTLDRTGTVLGADLGPVAPIDESVRRLRGTLNGQRDLGPMADDLRSRLFGDLPWVGRTPRLAIAPDGLLSHVPFELVLADANDGEFKVPRVTYLTSGRELPFLGVWDAEVSEGVLVFDVDYGPGRPWGPLPGTRDEGESIMEVAPNARVLRGTEATEAAILDLVRPRFLHVASHGFFLAETDPARFSSFEEGSRGLLVAPAAPRPVLEAEATGETDHPALRSGIVFAGANQGEGIVTAAEWSNLDLRGTRFVVMSACESGLGEIRNGDGVHGLRRALVLAGTQAQVLSLWRVDDAATALLIQRMYERLAAGANVGDALHAARMSLAREGRFRHPRFWAAFTVSGRSVVRVR